MNGMMSEEAGASDNRLSLNPSEFPFTENWQDGQKYRVTLDIEQVSPGEFTVIKGEEAGGASEEAAEPGTTEQPAEEANEAEKPAAYPNPAVDKMMRS